MDRKIVTGFCIPGFEKFEGTVEKPDASVIKIELKSWAVGSLIVPGESSTINLCFKGAEKHKVSAKRKLVELDDQVFPLNGCS